MINFSVIIPTYNRPTLVKRAIDSALINIVEGDEILVIDDGSEKDYSDIIALYDPNIVKYSKITNGGVSAARNHGLDIAKNSFIAFLDDDDEWYSEHLKYHRLAYKTAPNTVAVFCNFANSFKPGDQPPNGIAQWSRGKPQIQDLLEPINNPDTTNSLRIYTGYHYINQLSTDYILPSSFSFNRKICGDQDRFKVGLKRNQTWLFNSHICSYGPVAYVDHVTCAQRDDAETRATGISVYDTIISRLIVMKEEWGNNDVFLKQHNALYKKVLFEDFFHAFKISVRYLSPIKAFKLVKTTGLWTSVFFISRSVFFILCSKKVETRIT